MKTTLNYLAKGSLVAVLASVAACGAEAEGPTELALDVEQEPVINGTVRTTNRNVVALYTRPTESYTCGPLKAGDPPLDPGDQALGFTKGYTLQANTWWPRPCSGVLIKKDGDDNYILTARHCITQQGGITGTVIDRGINPIAVVVFGADGDSWPYLSRTLRAVQPSQTGAFTVDGLLPGRYFAVAVNSGTPRSSEEYLLSSPTVRAPPMKLTCFHSARTRAFSSVP